MEQYEAYFKKVIEEKREVSRENWQALSDYPLKARVKMKQKHKLFSLSC